MRSLALRLPAADFETLAQLGRSVIPSVSPGWTDHNIHDPGIMLLELLAWIADAQIYALSRLRRDERLAYARLLGIELRGPREARGFVWPLAPVTSNGISQFPWPPGHVVARRTPVAAADPNTPVFFTSDDVELMSATFDGLHTAFANGSTTDWTSANVEDGATFMPFGEVPQPGDRLVLRFRDAQPVPDTGRDAVVAIGVRIAAEPVPGGPSDDDNPYGVPRSVALRAAVQDAAGERPLQVIKDTTYGLLRSGVLLLRIRNAARPAATRYEISLQSRSGRFLRPPRVHQIAPNVLPVEQADTVLEEGGAFGRDLPDQTYSLKQSGLIFPFTEDQFVVHVHDGNRSEQWARVDDLQTCGPDDRAFELDPIAGVLRFGNGLNGRRLPAGAGLQVEYRVTAGAQGNLPAGRRWSVRGISGVFGTNVEATAGGAVTRGLEQLRRLARERSYRGRPIVTSRDLESAALSLRDLGVARAREYDARGDRRVRGARTLVVVGHRADGASSAGIESPEFLSEIRGRLVPRLPLGQQLEVVSPRFVPVRIAAKLVAGPRVDPANLRDAVRALLQRRLAIVAPRAGDSEWPFGRDITPLMVKGWLRNVAGVMSVEHVTVSAERPSQQDDTVRLGPIGLPLLMLDDDSIEITRSPAGARR